MQMKRISNQSDQYAQTEPNEPLKYRTRLGFNGFTFKDALEMLLALLIPATIGILAVVLQKNDMDLNQKNRDNDLYISDLQRDSDDQQTLYLANETVFSNYVKNMADIILYSPIKFEGQHYIVTRALTSTVVRQLDLGRKRLVIQFLYDAGILRRGSNILNPVETTDTERHLKGVVLDQVDFSGGLEFLELLLRNVTLINAIFSNSNLDGADFSNSILTGVNFSNTKLSAVRFINTQLQNTDFTGASVTNILLIQTNLSQSTITDEQMSAALFVYNTVLPNGTYARNKTFITNGDGRQGLNGWNITSGIIEVKDSYFMSKDNATMFQRINTTEVTDYASYESFLYCISMLFHGQQNLMIQIVQFDRKLTIIGVNNIVEITATSCNKNSEDSLEFCYWSYCKDSISGTDYIDLKFIFGFNNDTTNMIAVKDIQFTMTVE